jgi:hypothetical protein
LGIDDDALLVNMCYWNLKGVSFYELVETFSGKNALFKSRISWDGNIAANCMSFL